MARTVGTNLTAALDSGMVEPRYLLRLGSSYFADGGDADGANISWDSQTWPKNDFTVNTFAENGYVSSFAVVFNIPQGQKATFSSIQPSDACELYVTAALDTYGTDDVVQLFDGTVGGGWNLVGNRFTLECGDFEMWPATMAGENSGLTEVVAPGRYTILGGDYEVLVERGF